MTEHRKFSFKNDINISEIDFTIAKAYIEKYHYTHKMPQAVKVSYGCFYKDEISGVIVYSICSNRFAFTSCIENFDQRNGLELSRMWTEDKCPQNFESCCISKSISLLKIKFPQIKAVISYADPHFGHSGIIYKASNWLCLGKTTPEKRYLTVDNKIITRRGLGRRMGEIEKTSRERLLREGAKEFLSEPKYKYLYLLDNKLKVKL